VTRAAFRVDGELRVPGDKSISHRALIGATLATGVSRIRGILPSADVHSTAGVLRALGAGIPQLAESIEITGIGLRGLTEPSTDLDCGNSGTSARLLSGVVAGSGLTARFVGDSSLSRRPMRRVKAPLEQMGADIRFGDNWIEAGAPGSGSLRAIDLDCNHIPDAAMTLAVTALFARGNTVLRNIASWRVKETDRIESIAQNLRAMRIEEPRVAAEMQRVAEALLGVDEDRLAADLLGAGPERPRQCAGARRLG